MEIYVAGPLGFFEAGRHYLAGVVHPALVERGHVVLDPWTPPPELAERLGRALAMELGPAQRQELAQVNDLLGERNASLIEQCDLVLAILDGSDVDSGTASEIGFAAGIGRRILGVRTDLRLGADNLGAVVNLQVEHFIRRSGGAIHPSLDAILLTL